MGARSEFEFISRFFAPLSEKEPGAFNLSDDAACLSKVNESLVVTMDTLVAGVHFIDDTQPGLLAEKLLGVNLSDLAAMGAKPRSYLLSLALPSDVGEGWLEEFSASLSAQQMAHDFSLIGGDTVSTPGPLTLTACFLGEVEEGKALRRSDATVGDTVYVSGTIGDAALGLMLLEGKLNFTDPAFKSQLIGRYHSPQPRIQLGLMLYGLAHGVTDISDGLVADLGHICKASSVGALIQGNKVPLSQAAQVALNETPDLLSTVLTGGDDYELLFTAPPQSAQSIQKLAEDLSLPLTAIGSIVEPTQKREPVQVVQKNGEEISLDKKGYEHFD